MTVVTGGKKRTIDLSEQMFGKRLRLLPQYIVSLFMTMAKRRTIIDRMYPNLFQKVNYTKCMTFETKWRKIMPG